MIHFEVMDSPDMDVKESFKYFQDQIYLGKKSGNLVIRDPQMRDTHVMIEVVEGDLLIHPQPNVDHYLIDGKRATTIRKLSKGHVITIGNTKLKILDFAETPHMTKKEVLDEKLAKLLDEDSPRLQVIEKLTLLMK